MTEQTKVKGSALRRGVTAVIVLAVVFALLIIGYFAFLRPYLQKDDAGESEPVELIWSQEVESIDNRMLIYEHITREQMSKIEIHNPDNAKFGEQYVDWGFFRHTGEDDDDSGMKNGEFYLIGYEYAPFDETSFAYVVTAAGYTLANSRIEDHCTDFSKYGLDYATPEEATSITLTTTDGKVYSYYIGDKLPSGTGYYVRCMNSDTLLSGGEAIQRDSVYVLPSTYIDVSVMIAPQDIIDPYLTLPVDTTSTAMLDDFAIWKNEEQYFTPKLDEEGNQVYEDGEPVVRWNPMIRIRPIKDESDPFTLFSGVALYYAAIPNGYFASIAFESLIGDFNEFKGDAVVELGQTMVDENGEEYIGFTDETFEKYGLLDHYYSLYYKYNGVENYVYFSEKQEDGSCYAYSLTFNIIAKVSQETVYFLEWSPETFIQRQVVYLMIDDVESIALEGSYVDLGIANPDRKGEVNVNETFNCTDTGTDLKITDSSGNQINTKNFRQFYRLLILASIREEVSPEDIADAMQDEPMAKLTVKTRRKTVYKTDEAGNATTKVDYVLESVSKVFRFYRLTNGKVLCTIEKIDAEGNSLGESGSFYLLTSRVEELLSATLDLTEGITINPAQRH